MADNTFCEHFKHGLSHYFNVLNSDDSSNAAILNYIKYIFKADTFLFNFIENTEEKKFGKIQFVLFVLTLPILLLRKVYIIWIFHNIEPHNGRTVYSNMISKFMFNHAKLIVTLSGFARDYAKKRTSANVLFVNHPIEKKYSLQREAILYDFLIWGRIDRYKGILEFLEYIRSRKDLNNLRIMIVGKCCDNQYESNLQKYEDDKIHFVNQNIIIDELKEYMSQSKYVLLPYIGKSISSSGVLMDSISYYCNVIGPNVGAFKDTADAGVSFVYNHYNDIIKILNEGNTISEEKIAGFIEKNSWNSLSEKISNIVKSNKI